MTYRPSIPEQYSSLVLPSSQKELETLSKRTASATNDMAQFSKTSAASDFLEAKIEQISAELAVDGTYKEYFRNERKSKALSNNDYNDAVKVLDAEVDQKERELVILKWQKKLISDDIDEALPNHSTIEDAYRSILMTKITSAAGKQRKKKNFDQNSFSNSVLSFYGAVKYKDSKVSENYCHLTGWQDASLVKCAHIVPKSLESDELSYLLGARETLLSEPSNGIPLNSVIEGGLDNGWIVLVPDKPQNGEETIWRCVLVEDSIASDMILPGLKWRDVDGKELKFLTTNRPARRYLYLRYVMTFMHQQDKGNLGWLSRVQARCDLWATPGPYLRKSMLLTLARRLSGQYLPEVFYDSAFTTADRCPQRSAEDEEDLAMCFDHKIQDALAGKNEDEEEADSSDGDSD